MTTTAPQDRLNRLFANSPRPVPPTPGKPIFWEQELEEKKAKDEKPWRVPEVAEYPRQFKSPKKQPGRDRDILTSSDDEDEYVSLFSKKPSMKPAKSKQPKPRQMPEPNAFGYPRDAVIEPKGSIEYHSKGKWSKENVSKENSEQSDSDEGMPSTADDHGNPVVSHFCQFNLASKFPYKYMNDPNDRVSRHFFASNKFYGRKWDL